MVKGEIEFEGGNIGRLGIQKKDGQFNLQLAVW